MIIEKISGFDERLSHNLVEKYSDKRFVSFLSMIGNIYSIVLFFVVIACIPVQDKYNISFIACVSFFISTLIVFILKFTVKRKRKEYGTSRFLKDIDPYSFPSGHVSRITAIFAPFYDNPYLMVLALLLSFFVSFARISKGFHYFTDCLAGAMIGGLSSFGSLIIFYFFKLSIPF